jgi:putative membrane protein
MLIALPVLFLTLGLFYFVINALLLYFVGFLLKPHFYVHGVWDAFWGAVIITIVSVVLNALTGTTTAKIKAQRRSPPGDSDRGGDGPIIDV